MKLGRLPTIFAFFLLSFQLVIPWTGSSFHTQDGPSHLYTAIVTRDLLTRPGSAYASVYSLHDGLVSNWGTVILFNAASALAGIDHAEAAVFSFCVLAAFFAFSYLFGALDAGPAPWSPITNVLVNVWFLWIGFYNFYFGIALAALLAGFYLRRAATLTWRGGAVLAAGLAALFFIHVVAAAIAAVLIGCFAFWTNLAAPLIARAGSRPKLQPLGPAAAMLLPTAVLMIVYATSAENSYEFTGSNTEWALTSFPMHLFTTSSGRVGSQALLYPVLLFLTAAGFAFMRRQEWASPKGAFALAAALCFGLYVALPNSGLGGDEIKLRFAWMVFLFGLPAALACERIRPLRGAAGVYAACFTLGTLVQTMDTNVLNVAQAARAYALAADLVPPGAKTVRVRFPTGKTREKYGFEDIPLEPLFHMDSWLAARRGFLAVSEYQPFARTFPVVFRPDVISERARYQLWDLEGTTTDGLYELLNAQTPPIDYVFLLGDPASPARQQARRQLDETMQPAGGSAPDSFVRLYKRGSAAH